MREQVARLVKTGCDMSLRQLHVMFECQARGSLTVKQLSQSGGTKLDPPAVSRAVERLRKLGYANRQEHPADRRSVLVALTPSGSSFVKTVLASKGEKP